MKGSIVRHTQPKAHACRPPIRWPWRRLGCGARWRCGHCETLWEVAGLGWIREPGEQWAKIRNAWVPPMDTA